MKRAIGYIRISDKDQSNFSIAGQERYIRDYADKHDITIVNMFIDDGKSAKNFDRPDWKNLQDFIKNHHRDVDYMIVIKYDRFSRNTAQGLLKIEELEHKYKIIIVSVFEQMYIDYDSPFFFKQRADILVNAEFEWHVIRDRTRFGIVEASKDGRYTRKAPTGYKNSRDENNKPILLLNDDIAPVIRNIYNQYLSGIGIKYIFKEAKEKGLSLQGHSAITRILSNCVYAGLINVPAYKKEPAHYVKGLHKPIIEEHIWWEVQKRLGNIKQPKLVLNDEVPLRGQINCFCGKALTAGKSKGKKQYYWYYKCNEHVKVNIPASKFHSQFDEILHGLSFTNFELQVLYDKVQVVFKRRLAEKETNVKKLQREHASALALLESIEEKFIRDQINTDTYQKYYSKYKIEESIIRHKLEEEKAADANSWKKVESLVWSLTDIHSIYHTRNLQEKHAFIKKVFNSQIRYEEGCYRTPYIIPLFHSKALELNKKRLLIYEQPLPKDIDFIQCAPGGT